MDSNSHRLAALLLGLACALPAAALNHVNTVAPTVQGPLTVACSNVAQDTSRIASGASASDYWEGRDHYIDEILAAPQSAIQYDVRAPFDPVIYPGNFGRNVHFVAIVCYPTSRTNPDPDYILPQTGDVVPHMQPPGTAPKLISLNEYAQAMGLGHVDPLPPDTLKAKMPYIVFSHGLTGSPITSGYIQAMELLASHGFVVGAVFHGDPRFSRVRVEDLADVAYLLVAYNRVVEMALMRPLSLIALTDYLLADPDYSQGINPDQIGAFGASMGGEAVLHLLGAKITTTLGFDCRDAPRDPRIKAAVGYVPYAGQTFLPQFCDQQSGVDNIDKPFLALSGTADTTAPIKMMDSAMRRMKGSRYLIEMAGVPHEFKAEYAGDLMTWMVTFFRAYMHLDSSSMDKITRMKTVTGGPADSVRIDMHMPDPARANPSIFVAKEFRNSITNHYFVSAFQPEIDAVAGGVVGPGWVATGQAFNVYGPPQLNTVPVCRFYAPAPNSHFYTPVADVCDWVKAGGAGAWYYEGTAFQVFLSGASQTCPSGTIGVNRAYNNRYPQNDSNHRFSVSDSTMRDMVGEGWIYEAMEMCVPL